ncbi:MAG TPA: hypothetical protein VM582_08290, partial [Candidatus Thermoplasmatota archaeon]|nr:hypothetical protein [Candidatus Thermoplasmatota archaeon]
MQPPTSQSRWSPLLLALALVATVAVPAHASSDAEGSADAQAAPTRLAIGFHEYPAWLSEGEHYDGALVVRTIPALRVIAVMTLDPATYAKRQLADPNVAYVENDDPVYFLMEHTRPASVSPLFTPNDPQFSSMYGPQQVRAPLAWDLTTGTTDAAVCIIDTGVRRTHEDLGTARYLGGW